MNGASADGECAKGPLTDEDASSNRLPAADAAPVTEFGEYQGEFDCGEMHGRGVYTSPQRSLRLTCLFQRGRPVLLNKANVRVVSLLHGTVYVGYMDEQVQPMRLGRLSAVDGSFVYTGEFRLGVAHGLGSWTNAAGCVCQGQFSEGKRHGWGELCVGASMTTLTGQWQHNFQQGLHLSSTATKAASNGTTGTCEVKSLRALRRSEHDLSSASTTTRRRSTMRATQQREETAPACLTGRQQPAATDRRCGCCSETMCRCRGTECSTA